MKGKKVLAFCLTAAMVLSSFSVAFSAEETSSNSTASKFTDTSGHWAAPAIEKWAGYGVLNGSNGTFRPNDSITRAEMATMLDNMMDYQVTAKNTFSDVSTGAWYETAVLKANAAGILNGDGMGHANPTAKITKEQAVLMLARAFSVDADQGTATKFNDAGRISSWAKSLVFGMEAAGYISGYNNQFNPQSNITRAEVVTIINNAVKAYYATAGTYTDDVDGLAVIKAADVVIKDATINGDLIVAEGVADGNVTIDGATVKGDLIARGGGQNSVVIKGGADVQSVKVEKLDGKIRIFADGVVIKEVEAGEDVILEGAFTNVAVSSDVTVTIKGNVAKLDLEEGSMADIQSGTVTTLNLPAGATANIAGSATVKTANLTGKAEITGTGKIETANISGTGAVIEQKPGKTNLADGASAVIDDKATEEGTPSSSSGSHGNGGPSYEPYTYDEIISGNVIRPYTLVGSYDGVQINNRAVAARHTAYMWNADTDTFNQVSFNAANLVGNFVQLYSVDGDNTVDGALIVAAKDSEAYWDPDMYWLPGVGDDTDPPVDNAAGEEIFSPEHNKIPMGERLLTGYGLGDWSGTTDFSNIIDYADETGESLEDGLNYYWPQHDYYNAESNNTLTMLTHYKSYLQSTGSNCGLASALTVLEWFGKRGDLNDNDLVALREKSTWGGVTYLSHMLNVFKNLADLGLTREWNLYSSYDDPDRLLDSQWVQDTLKSGSPIMVGWNSFGGHWQVIIGYDNMGTKTTADDVLILMDPYDSTDHRNDGYNIQSYERLAYGIQSYDNEVGTYGTEFLVATPAAGWTNTPVDTGYTINTTSSAMNFRASYGAAVEDNWISYGAINAAGDIQTYYPDTDIWGTGDDGLAGPATGSYRHSGDVENSSYYSHFDIYNIDSDTNLTLLKNFKTTQQTTEWTCGLASALMDIEWFGKNDNNLSEIDLATLRRPNDEGPLKTGPSTVNDLENVFSNLNEKYNGDWAWFTMRDLDENLSIGGHELDYGSADGGLIPYLLENGIPMMIGWDEWGGHWQVIIGYDDMGTPQTQDDVLILADPYDTTDHNQDGYYLESFERLVFGWSALFDEDYSFIVAFPTTAVDEETGKTIIEDLSLTEPYYTAPKTN